MFSIKFYFNAFFISEATCNKADLVPGIVLIGLNRPQSWIIPLQRVAVTFTPASSNFWAYASHSSLKISFCPVYTDAGGNPFNWLLVACKAAA